MWIWMWLSWAAAAEGQPFEWSVRVAGQEQASASEGTLEVGVPGWSCGYKVDPPEKQGAAQFGVLYCEAGSGQVIDTLVFCQTSQTRPKDSGAGNLVLQRGGREISLEMSCRSPDHAPLPRLNLQPGTTPGKALGVPAKRDPRTLGSFRWQVMADDTPLALEAPGPVPQKDPAWTCSQQVSGLTDATLGYAELGTLSCVHGDTTVTTLLACQRPEGAAPACMVGSLRFAAGGAPLTSVMLYCESEGNPGCF